MTSRVAIPVDGSTRLFTVPFPYIHLDHVLVIVNRVLKYRGVDYEWVGPAELEFREGKAPVGVLELQRHTPEGQALVEFHNGSALTETELNLAVKQSLYLLQELRDYYDALINGSLDALVQSTGANPAGTVIDKVIEEILNSELLAELQLRIADIDLNAQTINAQRIRLDVVDDLINSVVADMAEVDTALINETNARVAGDTAIVETIDLIGAKSGDGTSFIIDLDTAKVSPSESLGQRLTAITSSIGEVSAAIVAEQTARADAISALASSVSNVDARVDDAEALITAEQTARVNADTALGVRVDGVLATASNNTSLILAEQTARANGDAAEAAARQTLQTQVNGHASSIQTNLTSINGLKAQYTVKINVDGSFAGFGLSSAPTGPGGAQFSEFLIAADRFAFLANGGTTVPFAADANGVYMNDAYIRNLTVDKITGGAVLSQWNFLSGGGRIVLDTGTYMKVIGVGFGVGNEFIEWFGPKMAISACSRATAISYETVTGDAYFGGSLSAGTLKNAVTSTQLGGAAVADTGSFGTNGNPKVVVYSLTYQNNFTTSSDLGGDATITATIQLERSLNDGASWTVLGSQTINGVKDFVEYEPGVGYIYAIHLSGAATYTDNSTTTSDFRYRARITAIGGFPVANPDGGTNPSGTQRLSVVSTEE